VVFLLLVTLASLAAAVAAGISFQARYGLILFAPLFSIAGAAAVQLLTDNRTRLPFGLTAAAITVVNIWFVLSGAVFQGRQLEEAPRFFASYRNLERVYQSLRRTVPDDRIIEVNADKYFPSAQEVTEHFLDPYNIPYYVDAREKERWRRRTPATKEPVHFEVSAQENTAGNGPGVALAWKNIRVTRADQGDR